MYHNMLTLTLISIMYNIDIKNIIKDYFNYIIRYKSEYITDKFLNIIEYVLHNPESNNEYQINFLFYSLLDLKV